MSGIFLSIMKTIRLMVVSVAIHIFLIISLFLGIAHALKMAVL